MEEREYLQELGIEEVDSSEMIELDDKTFEKIYEQSIIVEETGEGENGLNLNIEAEIELL